MSVILHLQFYSSKIYGWSLTFLHLTVGDAWIYENQALHKDKANNYDEATSNIMQRKLASRQKHGVDSTNNELKKMVFQ